MADQVIAGRYEILSKLGAGGAAIVYKVKDLTLKNICALKTLKYEEPKPQQIMRFQREAKAISGLRHPNIVSTLDFGVDDKNRPFLVMDFVEGASLKQLVDRNGPIEEEAALLIAEQICDALSYIHAHDILHRDIKSENIMVVGASYREAFDWKNNVNPTVKILDFGLAKHFDESIGKGLTKTGLAVGTPMYMSPEQCEARSIDQRSEVYSVGCLLFEMLTGEVPFKGANSVETIQMHIKSEPPSLADKSEVEFSMALEEFISKTLDKKPGDRFQSMEEMLSEVRSLLGKGVESYDEADTEYKPHKIEEPQADNSKLTTYIVGIVVLFLLAVAGVSAYRVLTSESKLEEVKMSGPDTIFIDTLTGKHGLYTIPGDCGINWSVFTLGESTVEDKQVFELNAENVPAMLSLCRQSDVSSKALAYAANLPLVGIGLDDRHLTFDQLRLFAKPHSTIEVMYLIDNEPLKDEDLVVLKVMKNLKYIILSENNFSDEALKYVSEIKSLVTLRFGDIKRFKGQGLKYLRDCPNLKRLSLYENKINKEGFQNLSKLKNLEVLNLSETNLKGPELKLISNLNLRKLDISKNKLKNEDLKCLYNMKTLKLLRVNRCSGVTADGVEKLKEALPECEIQVKKGRYTDLIDSLFVTEKRYD